MVYIDKILTAELTRAQKQSQEFAEERRKAVNQLLEDWQSHKREKRQINVKLPKALDKE